MFSFKNLIILTSIILITAAIGTGYYVIKQNMPTNSDQELISKVAKLIDLPNETPTIATITDPAQLQDQTFFAKALANDKVLVYASIGKAILYRPSTNKIIDISAVNIPTVTPTSSAENRAQTLSEVEGPQPTTQPFAQTRLALYNGTLAQGLITTVENNLKTKNYNIAVVSRGNAIDKYEQTIVVDISGTKSGMANQLAQEFKGIVGDLPPNEATASATPDKADILIFLGTQ